MLGELQELVLKGFKDLTPGMRLALNLSRIAVFVFQTSAKLGIQAHDPMACILTKRRSLCWLCLTIKQSDVHLHRIAAELQKIVKAAKSS